MPNFVVESYLVEDPAAVADAVADAVACARRVAELGDGVSYLRSTYVPTDETCLHLFEAPAPTRAEGELR